MKTHELIQGSPEWHAFRATHFPASEAPAMMGESKYKTRSQLLHEKHTGLPPDVDAATQRRFDDGHRFEALARPLAEAIIGEPLSPVTGSNGRYSASFDGITFMEDVCFEHKSLNEELRAVTCADDLALHYRIQMEQQLLVSGAEKCLFMATAWNSNDELQEQVFHWYSADYPLREKIISGWAQFEKDLAAYVPREIEVKPEAEAIMQLPSVDIRVKGELSICNLAEVTPKFDAFLSSAKTDLKTDEDFVNGEATAKFSRAAAKTLKLKAKETIDQISTVSEAVRTLELYAEKFDALGLKLEKAVKEQKEAIKTKAVTDAMQAFKQHCIQLDDELRGLGLTFPMSSTGKTEFAEAVKGKRTLESMHDSIGTALSQLKIDADMLAKDMRTKARWFKENNGSRFMFLFADFQQIISKDMDDFKLLVESRIEKHKKDEADKLEADRQRIQAEEQAKAEAKVRVEQESLKTNTQEREAVTHDGGRSETAVPVAQTVPVAEISAAVVEHQDEIGAFLKSRDFKEENKIRAILVEFVKFQAAHAMKKAA